MRTPSLPRLRTALLKNRAALVALAVGALALGILGTTQAITQKERTVETIAAPDAWAETGQFRYQVPVVDAAGPYPTGTTLPMGEPGYFETLSPRFHVDFSWSAEGAIPARAPAFVSLHLVVQGVGAHPWRIETDLANATGEASRPLPLGAWVDVPAAAQRLADQGHDKETSTWTVVARVSSAREGAVGTREFVMPIEHEPPLYVLPSADRLVSHVAHGEPEVRVHETRAGVAGIAHAPGAVALALGGILTLLVLVRLEDPA